MSKSHSLGAALLLAFLGLAACGGSVTDHDDVKNTSIAQLTNRSASLALACAGCHSETSTAVVSLKGYGAEALRDSLLRYKAETDGTTVMHRLARGYSDDDIELLANYFDQDRGEP